MISSSTTTSASAISTVFFRRREGRLSSSSRFISSTDIFGAACRFSLTAGCFPVVFFTRGSFSLPVGCCGAACRPVAVLSFMAGASLCAVLRAGCARAATHLALQGILFYYI